MFNSVIRTIGTQNASLCVLSFFIVKGTRTYNNALNSKNSIFYKIGYFYLVKFW
mgnify:CR=1 FL=1